MEKYVDYLYEDTFEKVLGSALILKLAKNSSNLEELAGNESALSALSRVLREDWKKNIDLASNIVHIFYCFSSYTQFHPIIIQYKIGSLCMELVDHELRRYDNLKGNSEDRVASPSSQRSASPNAKDVKKRQSMIPVGKRRSDSANRLSASSDDYRKSLPTTPVGSKILADVLNDMKDDENNQNNKQEQLLCVAVSLLINIAENTKVEEKMRKRNIIAMLVKMLDRSYAELLILSVKFLKKLSVFRENKDDMAELNVVEKLARLLDMNNKELNSATTRLLYNLSFDTRLRDKIVRQGFLPKLVSLLGDDGQVTVVLGILYHLSMNDKVKSMFTYTDCIPILMRMLLENKSDKLVIGLCINLALNKRNSEVMVEENRLHKLLARAFKTQDSLLMKMIHNIAMHEGIKQVIVEFVGDIAKAVTECDSEEFVLECVGILGCLTMPELDFNEVFQQFQLVPWIRNVLSPGKAEDDLVLEVVVMLGTAACDEDCAMLMCKADILVSLIELLKAKQEDDEIVLQIVYMFYQIIRHDPTRDYLIKETDAPAYLIDLMQDKNKEIAAVCDSCLDIISECNEDWKRRIMVDKFRFHNSHWLEMVESHTMDLEDGYGMCDEEMPMQHYLSADVMHMYQENSELDPDDATDYPRYSRELDIELFEDANSTLTDH